MNSKSFQLMAMLAMVGVGFPSAVEPIPLEIGSMPLMPVLPPRRAPGGISISMEPVDMTKLSRQQRCALSRGQAKRARRSQGRR